MDSVNLAAEGLMIVDGGQLSPFKGLAPVWHRMDSNGPVVSFLNVADTDVKPNTVWM